jgi:multicomponent Na+:H+ antiporter subunit C
MSAVVYGLAAFVFLVGLAGVATTRNLVHAVVCVGVAQSATYILLLAVGYRRGGTAPVFAGISSKRKTVDPVVQALALTDIVVGVAVTALLLVFALKAYERSGTLDPAELTGMHG